MERSCNVLEVAPLSQNTTKDGNSVIEPTWHHVTAWEGWDIHNLNQLKKGSFVHVLGRLRNRKYTTHNPVDDIHNKLERETP